MQSLTVLTPTGPFTLTERDGALVAARWGGVPGGGVPGGEATPLLAAAAGQVAEYFAGVRAVFELPLRLSGSAAQQAACAAMRAIPMGETRTYGALARELGVSAQAMGQLCGGNPLPLIVPCHRVLAAQGLGGFSAPGGIETKVWLLRHEGAAGLLL